MALRKEMLSVVQIAGSAMLQAMEKSGRKLAGIAGRLLCQLRMSALGWFSAIHLPGLDPGSIAKHTKEVS